METNQNTQLTPERIMQLITGHWAAATFGTALTYSVFTHIDKGADTCDVLAKAAGLSPRGTQALLDGLVGLGLLAVKNGQYENAPDAATFLVEGKATWMGGFGKMMLGVDGSEFKAWATLPQAVKTGQPTGVTNTAVTENPFWETLVTAIAPMSIPVAHAAAGRLGLANGAPWTMLDIGGGSGVYSAVWLGQNPKATSTQVDWANVNRIARGWVGNWGVGDRFRTVDGDFHTVDFGAAAHDYAVYSHIAHQETPKDNVAIFRKVKRALKPGGTLVVSDFVQNDDRTGNPFTLLFHLNMLLMTSGGATWRQADYRAWLTEAGFKEIAIEPTVTPATLIYAK